jgi:hypothetical protein
VNFPLSGDGLKVVEFLTDKTKPSNLQKVMVHSYLLYLLYCRFNVQWILWKSNEPLDLIHIAKLNIVCFQTAHPSTYVEFSKVNTRKKRRRDGDEQTIDSADDATDESIPEPKQEDTPFSFFEKKKCTKKRADELIMNYIVSDMRPLSTVESHAFKQMILGINPSI